MNNADLIMSHEVIAQSASSDQLYAYQQAVENVADVDLVAINDYLNAGVTAGSDWREYSDVFATYEWYQFAEAYRHVLDRDFSLD
jgi:hypothetical protein